MKQVIIISLVFLSCNTKEAAPILEDVKEPLTIDSLSPGIRERLSDIDSTFYYLGLNRGYAIEELKNEALYYKTGDEKYRKAFYKNQKKKVDAAKKGAAFQEKLKSPIN